jgi:hypothetical protein
MQAAPATISRYNHKICYTEHIMTETTLPLGETLEHPAIEIPAYDPHAQFSIADLDAAYPQWRQETTYDDPVLAAASYVRTRTLRDVGRRTSLGSVMMMDGGEGLEWAIKNTPSEVGRQFDSHGIANRVDPVDSFDGLVTKGIDPSRPFYSMSFVHEPEVSNLFGADHPLTSGGFIILAPRGQMLTEAGPSTVVLGEEYVTVMDLLQQKYPNLHFLSWDQAPEALVQLSNQAGQTDIPTELVRPTTPPTYRIPDPEYSMGLPVPGMSPPASAITPPSPPTDTRAEDVDDFW